MPLLFKDDTITQSGSTLSTLIDISWSKNLGRGVELENAKLYEQLNTVKTPNRLYTPPFNINEDHDHKYDGQNAITFDLNIYAKSQDDALQIVEQILPTFNPQYTVTIKTFPTEYPDFKEDIPIIIQGVTFSDDFEAEMSQRRTITYTLTFEMKVSFFGAIANSTVIRKSIADVFFRDVGAQGDSDILAETITVTPNPTTIIGMPDSDYGFDTVIDLAFDDSA